MTDQKTPKRQAAKRSTHTRVVGPCPGCKADVTAELDVATYLGDVTMDDQGVPRVEATNEVTAARIVHRCNATPGATLEPEKPADEPSKPRGRKTAAAKKTAEVKPT